MVDDLRTALEQAREDDRVKAVVLEVDSPGGEVTASDNIYNAVVKTRARKPVVVYMETSGRFWRILRFLRRQVSHGQRDNHHWQHRGHHPNI